MTSVPIIGLRYRHGGQIGRKCGIARLIPSPEPGDLMMRNCVLVDRSNISMHQPLTRQTHKRCNLPPPFITVKLN
jgi:hypothetical protein